MSTRRSHKKLTEKDKTASKDDNEKTKSKNSTKYKIPPSRKWTIEQETTLYKAICKFKPSGQHKHFRMISIYQMVNNPAITASSDTITIQDIWEKLYSLYDIDGLDELEDSNEFMVEEERLADDPSAVPYHGSLGGTLGDGSYLREFYLPWESYSDLILKQAIATDSQLSDLSDSVDSDDDQSDLNSNYSNYSKKRGRSQSLDSQAASETSEIENGDAEIPKKANSGSSKSTKPKTKKTSTPASRTTRSTRQRAAAAAAAAAVTSNKTKHLPDNTNISTNDEDEDTGTEHSERESSVPLDNKKSTSNRTKRSTRTSKTQAKTKKSIVVPTRRSTRRK